MAEKTIEQTIRETTKAIDKATEKLNPAFTKLVDNLAVTNRELAKEVAGIRLQAKATFAGALQANKFNKLGDNLAAFLKDGEAALDPKQFEQLKDAMGEMDLGSFEELNKSVIENEDALIDLEKQKSDRIDAAEKRGNILWKMEEEIQAQKKKLNAFAVTGGAVYERELKELQDMQSAESEKRKGLTAFVDAEIKEKTDLLDGELKERQEFNDLAVKSFKELNENAGVLGKFTDGIKDLTGLDIGGMIDGVMSKINSIGKVMTLGKEENMAGVLIEKLTAGFEKMGDAMGSSLAMFGGAAGSEAVGKKLAENQKTLFSQMWSKGVSEPAKAVSGWSKDQGKKSRQDF